MEPQDSENKKRNNLNDARFNTSKELNAKMSVVALKKKKMKKMKKKTPLISIYQTLRKKKYRFSNNRIGN